MTLLLFHSTPKCISYTHSFFALCIYKKSHSPGADQLCHTLTYTHTFNTIKLKNEYCWFPWWFRITRFITPLFAITQNKVKHRYEIQAINSLPVGERHQLVFFFVFSQNLSQPVELGWDVQLPKCAMLDGGCAHALHEIQPQDKSLTLI